LSGARAVAVFLAGAAFWGAATGFFAAGIAFFGAVVFFAVAMARGSFE
jgi:hypothetical protein